VPIDNLFLQHAVHSEPDPQEIFLGLDVDIRRRNAHGIVEHALNQAYDRRVGRTFFGRELIEIKICALQLFVEFFG
jgi:hypothetical protein